MRLVDRVVLLMSPSPKSPNEKKVLGPKKGDDIRLSCCTRASGDVVVQTKP